ncbi:MAG: acyl-CoA dehydrogenase family protein [Planctomycetota bacterium]|nr:acyl-CoA dehydrogenase family protein [Planctomycetota bacterium]
MQPHDQEYDLPPEAAAWRARAAAFAQNVLAPVAREADRAGRFSRDVVRQLGQAGLIGAALPASAGGGAASALAACAIAEEIGAVDGSTRGFLAVQAGLVLAPLVAHAPAALRDHWAPRLTSGEAIGACALTEPEAGSDLGAMRTTIRPDGDDVVIDGEKVWITNGGVADVLLVFGQTDPTRKTRGLECYLVAADTPGLERQPMPGRELGHRASDHARLVFRGLRVPKAQRVGPALGGMGVAMLGLEDGRLNVAAGAVGVHRACLEASIQFARTRRQFGQRIGDFQQVGATLASMDVALRASRLLVHQAARLKDRGLDNGHAVSAAKLHATEAALAAATQAIQLHGSRGYSDELPLERHWRDVMALTIYEGTSNIQRVILARMLLGRDEPPEGSEA